MESYCVRCKKYAKNINLKVPNTSNGKTTILFKCATCGSKNPDLIENKNQKDYKVI